MRETVGPFRILRTLGEGGMGVVYEARDERLGRPVALKMMLPASGDPSARERLRREARTAASVGHPNVCQVFEVGEDQGDLYVAMELLDGEPLSTRIGRGPMPASEALRVTEDILAALDALHARGILHRDLKPSNVFLTSRGTKLLDFGLALPTAAEAGGDSVERRLTMTGTILGTPQYLAPERWTHGADVGPEADLFAVGALLYEMVAGRPAFDRASVMEIAHAVMYEPPPSLSGADGIDVVDRIVRTALARDPKDRYPTAAAMALAVRECRGLVARDSLASTIRAVTRLIVLPFRMLRPDPDYDFLAVGIPDAITTSLSGLPTLMVRSSHAAAKFATASGAAPDLKAIAEQAGVDAVVVGTMLRGGDRLRVTAQLLEAPSGTVLSSDVIEERLDDVLKVQDEIARRVVESLAIPLSARDRSDIRRKTPATARANELFLRANQLSLVADMLPTARDLYRQSIEEDPRFAPAWARLGRVYRVLSKFVVADTTENLRLAEEAFQRALDLDPELSLAHFLVTHIEVEERGRARDAMVRLLGRVRARPADADLHAALVLACRFAGLLDASLAADRRARRLDPGIRTSVMYTHFMRGEYAEAAAKDDEHMRWMERYAWPMIGREADALAGLKELNLRLPKSFQHMLDSARTAIERDREGCIKATAAVTAQGFRDPEGLYFCVRHLARVGAIPEALELLERVVRGGFHVATTYRQDPWLDPLHGEARFQSVVDVAEAARRQSLDAYRAAGGESLLIVEH